MRGWCAPCATDGVLPANVELRHVDALEVDLGALATALGGPVRVVGNLPYAVSSPLLRRLLDARQQLQGWSVMLQRELADRLVAAPGSRALRIAHGAPPPHGRRRARDGAAARLLLSRAGGAVELPARHAPADAAALDADGLRRVERVVRAAFSARRKTLANALRGGLGGAADPARIAAALAAAGLAPQLRAERVEPAAFVALCQALAAGA